MLLAVGVVLSWWQIWRPLTALDRGDTEVTIYNLGIGGAVILTIFGAGLTLIGQGLENALESIKPDESGKISAHFIMVVLPIALLSLAAYIWVQMRLTALGFTRN